MTEKKQQLEHMLDTISSAGLTLSELIECEISKDRSFLDMTNEIKTKFAIYLDELTGTSPCTKSKGDILEGLACCLMYSGSNLFSVYRNCHTSTNEIDLLLRITEKGRYVLPKQYGFLGDNDILCECKNYSNKLGVTYIGKFYSLLKLSGCKIGILFTVSGLTGRNKWLDGLGLVKKIALKDNLFILDFTKEDYEKINKGERLFWDLLEEKYMNLLHDIDISQFAAHHESEAHLLAEG